MINRTRTCATCGKPFQITADEIADGSFSPDCTPCLKRACESNARPTPEKRLPPMPREDAAAILGAEKSGATRRSLRALCRKLGYGGGSRDLDVALERAAQKGKS